MHQFSCHPSENSIPAGIWLLLFCAVKHGNSKWHAPYRPLPCTAPGRHMRDKLATVFSQPMWGHWAVTVSMHGLCSHAVWSVSSLNLCSYSSLCSSMCSKPVIDSAVCVSMHAKLAAGWLGVKARQTCTECGHTWDQLSASAACGEKKVCLCFVFTWNLMVHLSA